MVGSRANRKSLWAVLCAARVPKFRAATPISSADDRQPLAAAGRYVAEAELPRLIQKFIIPIDQRRSKPLLMTALSLDFRLHGVSSSVEILAYPHRMNLGIGSMDKLSVFPAQWDPKLGIHVT